MISFEDFKKMDIKIGKVIEVKDHPNADKLYLIACDLGDSKKQLIAGLKGSYSADELKGKQVVVLTNLEPAVIRGIKSEGMVLAASDDEKISVLVPEKQM
jgi:methionyl-tRNA synthetase